MSSSAQVQATETPGRLFLSAYAQHVILESLEDESRTERYQSKLSELIATLKRLVSLLDRMALFSDNEDLEDIHTVDLRLLVVRPMLADALLRTNPNNNATTTAPVPAATAGSGSSPQQARLSIIDAASQHFVTFLETCELLGLLKDSDIAVLASRGADVPGDAQAKRAAKIATYKREKEAKTKFAELLLRTAGTSSLSKAAAGKLPDTTDADADAAAAAPGASGLDEDTERDMTLGLVELWILKACEQLAFARQETQLIQFAINSKAQAGDQDSRVRQNAGGSSSDAAASASAAKPLKPFTITREMIRRNLLGHGYSNLPTMSVEQFMELEIARGNFLTGGGNEEESKQNQIDQKILEEESNEESDKATYKARDWDEFTDGMCHVLQQSFMIMIAAATSQLTTTTNSFPV
ncbi:hypothetical protein CAOG_003153 [Capsaspora owczarzaki ATCC 30864]|uniref:Uncharacterized protein n=1 Tax=Capsaspora owczarzaki (strain ATCC 30864) TaxID=595528 RepID=A0A0D2WMN7_CAPO3|nr:hypothetical protein CAOG_003153 [Capsaspora owczarzaki ATCC 30864]